MHIKVKLVMALHCYLTTDAMDVIVRDKLLAAPMSWQVFFVTSYLHHLIRFTMCRLKEKHQNAKSRFTFILPLTYILTKGR